MTLPNHIVGGVVFTGVFAGIAGINILESPGLIAMTVLGSTIADVDVPSSLWGQILRPLSVRLNRRFGHRTFTHSLLFMFLLWGLLLGVCSSVGAQAPYPTVFLLAFGSHLVFDMMTVQGVQLFYPYKKTPCVIPADPTLRLKTNNPGSELAVFGFFVLSGLFMQPLMADGFWTSYNRLFGTLAHLQSEFEKADDLLEVSYRYREGSQEATGRGYVVEATGTSATLWTEGRGWNYLDGSPTSTRTILEVIPEHTDQRFQLVRQSFVGLSADSLEQLLAGRRVYGLEFSGNEQLEAVYEAEGRRQQVRQTKFKLSRVDYIHLQEIVTGTQQREVVYRNSPRIRTLESRAAKLNRKQQQWLRERSGLAGQIREAEHQLEQTSDIYRRTQLLDQLRELRTQQQQDADQVSPYADQLRELEIEVEELRAKDRLEHEERLAVAAEKAAAANVPLRLSGVATFVEFLGPAS